MSACYKRHHHTCGLMLQICRNFFVDKLVRCDVATPAVHGQPWGTRPQKKTSNHRDAAGQCQLHVGGYRRQDIAIRNQKQLSHLNDLVQQKNNVVLSTHLPLTGGCRTFATTSLVNRLSRRQKKLPITRLGVSLTNPSPSLRSSRFSSMAAVRAWTAWPRSLHLNHMRQHQHPWAVADVIAQLHCMLSNLFGNV